MGDNAGPANRPEWPAGEPWGPPPGPQGMPGGAAGMSPGAPAGPATPGWPAAPGAQGMPPGTQGWPGAPGMTPGMPQEPAPGMPWAPPGAVPGTPPPPRKKSRVLMAVLITLAVLAVGCVGAAGFGAVRLVDRIDEAGQRAADPLVPGLPDASGPARPADEDDAVEGPQASSTPVRTDDDLQRVCDSWYYPQSPKYDDKATNAVSVLVKNSKDFSTRTEKTLYDIPDRSGAAKQAWDPPSPQKVPLVACVDLLESGKRVKSCQFEEPDGKLPMRQGVYQLTLYEVATGRKITEKRLTGEDQECPFFVLLGEDRTVYSQVADRQIYETLRRYVEK